MRLTTWSLILTVFNVGLSIGVVIAVGMLLYFQLKSIIKNRTGIEDWILDKAVYRRKMIAKAAEEACGGDYQIEPFVYPYDLGKAKNILQVLNLTCLPVGDGTTWPVIDRCDQYTLTVSLKLDFTDSCVKAFVDSSGNNLRRKWRKEQERDGIESSRKFPDRGCL